MKAIHCLAALFLLAGSVSAQPAFLVLREPGPDEMVLVMSRTDGSGQVVHQHGNVFTTGRVPNFEALRHRLGLGKMRPHAFVGSKELVRWQGAKDGWSSASVGGCIDIPDRPIKPPTAAERAQFRIAIGELRAVAKLATQPVSKPELTEIAEQYRQAGL